MRQWLKIMLGVVVVVLVGVIGVARVEAQSCGSVTIECGERVCLEQNQIGGCLVWDSNCYGGVGVPEEVGCNLIYGACPVTNARSYNGVFMGMPALRGYFGGVAATLSTSTR